MLPGSTESKRNFYLFFKIQDSSLEAEKFASVSSEPFILGELRDSIRHLQAEERTIHGTKLLIIENYLIIHNCLLIISSFQLERRRIDQISLRFAQLQLWLSGQLLLNEYGHIQFISCICVYSLLFFVFKEMASQSVDFVRNFKDVCLFEYTTVPIQTSVTK